MRNPVAGINLCFDETQQVYPFWSDSYEVGTLTCLKCEDNMRVISFIQDQEVIQKILTHLGLWLAKLRVPPKANVEHPPWRAPPKELELEIDYSDSQAPFPLAHNAIFRIFTPPQSEFLSFR